MLTREQIRYLDALRCYFMRSPDAASEIESRLEVASKLAKARAVKSGSMEAPVASIEKPKDRTRAKTARAAKITERKMGEMLAQTERAKPPGHNQHKKQDRSLVVTEAPTLVAIGVTKRESSEAQKLAALPAGRVGHGVANHQNALRRASQAGGTKTREASDKRKAAAPSCKARHHSEPMNPAPQPSHANITVRKPVRFNDKARW